MSLPTEPIGSIPRPKALQDGMGAAAAGEITAEQLDVLYDDAVADTLRRFEATGSPVVTDGEQRKPSFATYPVAGLPLAGGGVTIPFEDGHTRQLPVLTTAPFHYATYAWSYLDGARPHTGAQLKQAVISASAISLMYPGRRHRGLPARGLHRGPRSRGGLRDARLPGPRRDRPDRLHRGPPVTEARPVRRAARCIRRPQQPRPRRAQRRGAIAGRGALAVRAATRTRRTAPTWTTRSCCRPCAG